MAGHGAPAGERPFHYALFPDISGSPGRFTFLHTKPPSHAQPGVSRARGPHPGVVGASRPDPLQAREVGAWDGVQAGPAFRGGLCARGPDTPTCMAPRHAWATGTAQLKGLLRKDPPKRHPICQALKLPRQERAKAGAPLWAVAQLRTDLFAVLRLDFSLLVMFSNGPFLA